MRRSLLGIVGIIISVIGVILTLYFGLVQRPTESPPSTQTKQEFTPESSPAPVPPAAQAKNEHPPGPSSMSQIKQGLQKQLRTTADKYRKKFFP